MHAVTWATELFLERILTGINRGGSLRGAGGRVLSMGVTGLWGADQGELGVAWHWSSWRSWTLLLVLAIVGALFIAAASFFVFWLLRRMGRPKAVGRDPGEDPARERGGEPLPVSPLEEGTILDDGRFVVLAVREQRDAGIIYEVRDLEADCYCQVCGSPFPNPNAIRCPTCHTAIPSERTARLIAKETLNPDRFASGKTLRELEVRHPAVLSPMAVFSAPFQDETRYYLVMPDVERQFSGEDIRSYPYDQVMGWGITLADGLAALHRHGIAFRDVKTVPILLDGDRARWSCCGPLISVQGESGEAVDRAFASDVRGLGRWMLLQATGETSLGTELSIPEPLSLFLTDVLTATYPMSAQQLAEQLDRIRRRLVIRKDVRLRVGAGSDTGKLRELNEDSLWTADYSDAFDTQDISVGAFVVADGVGGHAAGDVASQLTVDVIRQYGDELRRAGEMAELPDVQSWLKQAAGAANDRVHKERQAVASDMGSTLVMALFVGNEFSVLNIGDSRAYRLGLQGIQQITVDHTLVQRLVTIGQISRDEAKMHPRRNVIYRVIGGRAELEYDLFDDRLAGGEALLLCSDGLTDMLEDPVIWQIWREMPSPQAACDHMIAEANRVGGHDNITAIIVQLITT
jgi:PPM family protein phosphatase